MPTKIQIARYSPTGELLSVHESIMAGARAIGRNQGAANISTALDKSQSAYGYVWRSFTDEAPKKIGVNIAISRRPTTFRASNHKNKRPIASYDKDGKLTASYESISAAGRALNTPVPSIVRALNEEHQHHTASGLYWRYVDDVAHPPKKIAPPVSPVTERSKARKEEYDRVQREKRAPRELVVITANETRTFATLQEAGDYLGVSREAIRQSLAHNRLCKGAEVKFKNSA